MIQSISQAGQVTYADRWFDAFPDSLPGAYKINKSVRTPGAEYILVHIKQSHYTPNSNKTELAKTKEVQSDIYKIISGLLQKGLIRGIYHEGTESFGAKALKHWRDLRRRMKECLTHDREPLDIYSIMLSEYEESIRNYNSMLKTETDTAIITMIKKELVKIYRNITEVKNMKEREEKARRDMKEKREKSLKDFERSDKEYELRGGAAAKLHNEGKIELFAAETYEANLRAQIAFNQWLSKLYESAISGNKIPDAEMPPEVTEMREDLLLDFVFNADDKAAVTVYGAAHDWTNNIEAWNRNHPDKKFSLIVITPESYERHEREVR